MAGTLLQGPVDFLRAYAEASADWSSYQRTGDAGFLRNAANRLCGAGRAVLEDHGFWMNLETELGAQVGPAWQEFVQRRQDFLDLEQSIVIAGAQMKETDAVALITELEASIESFVATAGNISAASHVIQTAAFRTRFEALNNYVCNAGIVPLQGKGSSQGSAVRRIASAVFRTRKSVGGIGLIGLNSAVGAGAIALPFAIPVAAGIVPSSLVGGITMLLT